MSMGPLSLLTAPDLGQCHFLFISSFCFVGFFEGWLTSFPRFPPPELQSLFFSFIPSIFFPCPVLLLPVYDSLDAVPHFLPFTILCFSPLFFSSNPLTSFCFLSFNHISILRCVFRFFYPRHFFLLRKSVHSPTPPSLILGLFFPQHMHIPVQAHPSLTPCFKMTLPSPSPLFEG